MELVFFCYLLTENIVGKFADYRGRTVPLFPLLIRFYLSNWNTEFSLRRCIFNEDAADRQFCSGILYVVVVMKPCESHNPCTNLSKCTQHFSSTFFLGDPYRDLPFILQDIRNFQVRFLYLIFPELKYSRVVFLLLLLLFFCRVFFTSTSSVLPIYSVLYRSIYFKNRGKRGTVFGIKNTPKKAGISSLNNLLSWDCKHLTFVIHWPPSPYVRVNTPLSQ